MKTAVWVIVAGLSILGEVSASPVRVTFSGTYTNVENPDDVVFGVGALPAPFEYTIIYDPTLNTSPYALTAGTIHNGHLLADNFIGYSASGILATSFTFGSKTWATAAISPRGIDPTTLADFWLNADISSATPTATWLYLEDFDGGLSLGGGWEASGTIHFHDGQSTIDEYVPDFPGFYTTNMTIARYDLPVLPDAGATVTLIGLGLLSLSAVSRWWKHRTT